MANAIRNLAKIAALLGVAGLTGCVTTADHIDSAVEAERVGAAETVVFGKFRLIRNEHEVTLGEGLLANTAKLHLEKVGTDGEIIGKVGAGGDFAWALTPGTYRITRVDFKYRGEDYDPEANFAFEVSGEGDAAYIGTITLEAQFAPRQYGTIGLVDRFTVSNDCDAECGIRLTRLGLETDAMSASLVHWDSGLAGAK